jgi:F-type H+-transporting ATPase subunit a
MILASENLMDHVRDTPWAGWFVDAFGRRIPLMTSGVATMLLVAGLLTALLVWMARRHRTRPGSMPGAFLEVFVLFVRDRIAAPSMGPKRGEQFLPYLLTAFVFVLGMNLSGLLPTQPISQWLTGGRYPVGHTPTSSVAVCAMLALLTLGTITVFGLHAAARRSGLPMALALPAAPVLWFLGFAPHIPGKTGKIMSLPLAVMEFIGLLAKCFALMVRLVANMLAGHIMLAVVMMFIVESFEAGYVTWIDHLRENDISVFYVGPICLVGSVLMSLMELMVATLQAYIYTFLTAIFLGLYIEPEH